MDNGGYTMWVDGYAGEDTITADEMRGDREPGRPGMPFALCKRLCDWQPLRLQAKGTSIHILARRIVFTSTMHPLLWYEDPDGEWRRRLNDFGFLYTYPGGVLTLSPGQWATTTQ